MRISFFILLFFAGCISFAQGVKYRCKVYSVVDGLSQSSVYSVFQDSQGFIWAGTADGLNRFDGYSFKVFRHTFSNESSPPDNNIRQINEINDSLLIFSTDLGYCIYNRRNGNFNTNPYETPQPKKLYSKKIFIKDKTVWIYYNYSNVLRKFDTENDADILEKKLSPVNGEYYYRPQSM